jgi:hypothetical protein
MQTAPRSGWEENVMTILRKERADEIFKLSFQDLSDVFLAGVLVAKLSNGTADETVKLSVGLEDLFFLNELKAFAPQAPTHRVRVRDPIEESLEDELSLLFGISFEEDDDSKKRNIASYFESRLDNSLRILRDGDSCNLPAIQTYDKIGVDPLGVAVFEVQLVRQTFLDAFKANLADYVYLQERAYGMLLGATDMSYPAISIEKQLTFLRKHLDVRSAATGESRLSFRLKDVNFRRAVITFEGLGGQGVMPTPLTGDAGVKAVLPFLLQVQGELDIEQIRIISPIPRIDDVEVQFSVHRPALNNLFEATYCSLPPERRARMTLVEIECYERVLRVLQRNMCFLKRPDLERDFGTFAFWAIRKVVYCLEEPSFLKHPTARWLADHTSDDYKKMEDDFFLPFLYERLRDDFTSMVSKKPERFGGNVDILFGEIPIELKVRRGHRGALVDTIVDEKYRPTSQAATYAALTRLGCVLVLDIPTDAPEVTNVHACVNVVTRHFPESTYPTSIAVFVFHCNLPRPSSAV